MEFFGNRQKAAKMSQRHISPSLLITEAPTASGPTCFKRRRSARYLEAPSLGRFSKTSLTTGTAEKTFGQPA
jgi:hypothetical protein